MPNQLNFPDKLISTHFQRPERLSKLDLNIMQVGTKQVLFGTTGNDIVEIWIYNGDGTISGHMNLAPTDTALSLTTYIDQPGPQELLNLDMVDILNRMAIQPGRYAIVANFFRNEVGSEDGYKLYISDISTDRLEVRIRPVKATGQVIKDIYEFVTPSVPKFYANALLSQTFNKSLDAEPDEILTWSAFRIQLDRHIEPTMSKVRYAGREVELQSIYNILVDRAYARALDKMADDTLNLYVQQPEIENYVIAALTEIIAEMTTAGEIDPHFELI